MRRITCCFTGHRVIHNEDIETIKDNLSNIIESLIKAGIIYFGVGGALGFDMYAAEAVIEMKKKYTFIRLILVLPCREYDKFWTISQKERYAVIKKSSDKVLCTEKDYFPGCMQKRNRHLVDHSSVCVAYVRKTSGGTAYTVNYALKQGLNIINI